MHAESHLESRFSRWLPTMLASLIVFSDPGDIVLGSRSRTFIRLRTGDHGLPALDQSRPQHCSTCAQCYSAVTVLELTLHIGPGGRLPDPYYWVFEPVDGMLLKQIQIPCAATGWAGPRAHRPACS